MEDKMFHAIKYIRCIKNKKVAFPDFFWFVFKIIKNRYGRLFMNCETKLEGFDKPRNGTFHDLFKIYFAFLGRKWRALRNRLVEKL